MKKEEHNARFQDHYIAIGIRISYFRKLRGAEPGAVGRARRNQPRLSPRWRPPGMAVGIS